MDKRQTMRKENSNWYRLSNNERTKERHWTLRKCHKHKMLLGVKYDVVETAK
jgi:hypothetical protein